MAEQKMAKTFRMTKLNSGVKVDIKREGMPNNSNLG